MALIGNGAQSEFQALAFHHGLGIREIRAYDLDPLATARLQRHLAQAGRMAGRMRNLDGGHGDGCNFEDGDRFSHRRRIAHQLPGGGEIDVAQQRHDERKHHARLHDGDAERRRAQQRFETGP